MYRHLGFDDHCVTRDKDKKIQKKINKILPSRWKVILDSQHKCWVCDRHIYSLMFWNEGIGKVK
jgi:hypothetical protein